MTLPFRLEKLRKKKKEAGSLLLADEERLFTNDFLCIPSNHEFLIGGDDKTRTLEPGLLISTSLPRQSLACASNSHPR